MISSDNTTPLSANDYDMQINKTVLYYHEFYEQTFSVVIQKNFSTIRWLDLGCGTGILESKANSVFSDIQFVMVDPSEKMLAQAKEKTAILRRNIFVQVQIVLTSAVNLKL